jgi:hypothetical protein
MQGSDTEAHDRGEVGVTPLMLDLWDARGHARAEQVAKQVMDSSVVDRKLVDGA